MNHRVAAELDAQGSLDLSRGGSEIIRVRISLILWVLIRALLEYLKSGQSVAAEALALALLVNLKGTCSCVLQISLISFLMDCPAPGSVSGWLHDNHPPSPSPQGYAKTGLHFKLHLHLLSLLYPNLLCSADSSLRLRIGTPSVLSRSMMPTPLSLATQHSGL